MSKLYRNLFTILAISPVLTLADLEGVKCVDCNSVTAIDCPVRTRGYMCLPSKEGKESWLKHEYSNFSDDALETDDLDVCIPDGITIKTVLNYCCVWSPKTGCQLLRGPRVHKSAMECVRCTVQDLDRQDDPHCPCLEEHASQMCVSAWLLVVAVQLLLYN